MERDQLLTHEGLREAIREHNVAVELSGFGPIAAAATAARLLATRPIRRLILAGIAGSYDPVLPVGSAWQLGQVGCWGIGIGSGSDFRPGCDLGWSQLPAELSNPFPGEVLPLFQDPAIPLERNASLALTCTASAHSPEECELRQLRFPQAAIEEMEGFGVALAALAHQCQTGAPIAVGMVRGISNRAGDRDKTRWQVASALNAVAGLLLQILSHAPVAGQELPQ